MQSTHNKHCNANSSREHDNDRNGGVCWIWVQVRTDGQHVKDISTEYYQVKEKEDELQVRVKDGLN